MLSLISKDARIIYKSIQSIAIPKDQLYIHDEECCPCGSGKVFLDCCKGKQDAGPVVSRKPSEVLVMEQMRKSMQRDNICLHPDQPNCKGRIKEAHALQNHKIISALANKNNHVVIQDPTKQPLVLNQDPTNPDIIIPFERVSGNKATTQNCFCEFHDTTVFSAIEAGAPDFDPTSDTMTFIYAYKAFIFEYAKQRHLMKIFRGAFAKRPQVFSLPNQVKEYRVQCLRMDEFEQVKNHYDKEIMGGTHGGVKTVVVRIPYRIGFANYAYIALDFDLEGNRIDTVDDVGIMHRLSVTVFPEEKQSYILLSCLDTEEIIYHSFFQSICSADLETILFYFNLMLPLYSENIVMSEKLWNSQDEKGKLGLTYMANLTGDDHFNLSQTLGMVLRNAAKQKIFDYSKHVGFDLFQKLYEKDA